jgi:hypothetical protein
MSESVDNDGESYSNQSRKYSQSSPRSSESPSSESYSPSYNAPKVQPQTSERKPIEKDKVEEIKKLLKETEVFLIQYGKDNFDSLNADDIKKSFRNVVLSNEKDILAFPTLNTLVTAYKKTYESLSDNEKQQNMNKLLMDGLNEFAEQKRQENSKLKYW